MIRLDDGDRLVGLERIIFEGAEGVEVAEGPEGEGGGEVADAGDSSVPDA